MADKLTLPKRGKSKICNGFTQINGVVVKPDMDFWLACADDGKLFYFGRDGQMRRITTHQQGEADPLHDDKLATVKARAWWDEIGRHMINQKSNQESVDVCRPGTGQAPGFIVRQTPVITLPSGILRGLEFEQLSQREQERVVEAWRHFKGQKLSADITDAEQRLNIN